MHRGGATPKIGYTRRNLNLNKFALIGGPSRLGQGRFGRPTCWFGSAFGWHLADGAAGGCDGWCARNPTLVSL